MSNSFCRPLTKEELAKRYEAAKQRHAEKNAEKESESGETTDQNEDSENIKDGTVEGKEIFVAFARIYSGTLKKGAKLYVLGPKYDPLTKLVETKDGSTVRLVAIFFFLFCAFLL